MDDLGKAYIAMWVCAGIAAVVATLCVIAVTVFIVRYHSGMVTEDDAIKHHAAHRDSVSGEFTWNDEPDQSKK